MYSPLIVSHIVLSHTCIIPPSDQETSVQDTSDQDTITTMTAEVVNHPPKTDYSFGLESSDSKMITSMTIGMV